MSRVDNLLGAETNALSAGGGEVRYTLGKE
jgi:hypothetical protein